MVLCLLLGALACRGADGGGGNAGTSLLDPGQKGLHRLNSAEYNATIQDVLGTTLQPATSSWRGGEELAGFDNIASQLGIDEAQYNRYFLAAQPLAAEAMASEANQTHWVTCNLTDRACLKSSVEAAGLQLFRRPLEPEEVQTFQRVYDSARALGDDESAAFTLTLRALLSSAEFLYRIELDPQPESREAHPLGAFELASRLSYFLWSSAPDDTLLQAAGDGSLTQPDGLATAVDRMLDDPKSQRFVGNFAGQWLGVRQVPAHPASPSLYQWTPRVALSASREMFLFFGDFLQSDRSWFEFATADFNYVDGDLADLYGMPPKAGTGNLERVEYRDDQRAGFFGLAGFLALSSLDRRTSPSRRGKWIAENLLCSKPPDPPKDVPMLQGAAESAGGGASTLAVRQRLEQHRTEPSCAACHALFDPYGLALEEYDAIGVYRTTYLDGTPVDATVTLPASSDGEGVTVTGLADLARAVSSDPRFGECLAEKLFTYGLGRIITPQDEPHLLRARDEWLADGQVPSLRRLIHALISTDAFRARRGGDDRGARHD